MVAIIGILAAIAIPQFKAYQDKVKQKQMGQMMNPLKPGDQISELPQADNVPVAQEKKSEPSPVSNEDERIQSQLAVSAGQVTPKMINAYMRIDGAAAGPGRTFTYHYTQMNVDTADHIPAGEFEKNFAPQMKKTVCTSGALKTLLADDVTVLYDYSAKDGSSLGVVEITRAVCG
jgi:Tfp pilus assembly major pilin PilA